MINKLAALLRLRRKPQNQSQAAPSEQVLQMEKDRQAQRLELAARQQRIEQLQREIERQAEQREQTLAELTGARLESLFSELAGPASQFRTQADLVERQGRQVPAEDLIAVTRRMVRALERHGVVFEGELGDQEPFDPNRHIPLQQAGRLNPGQPVTIRFSGVSYRGKMIYKALVELG